MNVWTKILLYFPIWFLFLGLFFGIVFIVYPESLTGSRNDFDLLISTNYVFLLISQIAILLGTFSAIYFVSKIIDKQKPLFLKSILNPKGVICGIGLGTIAILTVLVILSITTKLIVKFQGINLSIIIYVILFFLVAISEEVMARGFLFVNLYNHSNKYFAIILSSIVFSLLHVFNSSFNLIGMLNIILIGILFCQLYLMRMNLSIPIGFHFIWNFLQGPVFGFSVSGLNTQAILKIENISGSNFSFEGFGLEGSLISTLVIGIFLVYIFLTNTRKIIRIDNSDNSITKSVELREEVG